MCKKMVVIALGMAVLAATAPETRAAEDAGGYVSKVWVADNGDGTYKNPILYADYSDPDVVRVGEDYYMTASSFTSIPGLPILHSKDLVNWTLIAHALASYPEERFERPQHGMGVWAPSIRYHNDWFYVVWGDPDSGIYTVRAKHPEGPWEKPVLALAGKGLIDPCPLWDNDGKAWIVHAWAGSRSGGFNSVLTLREMSPDAAAISTEGRHIIDGHEKHPTLEGPKFYKHNGWYYIFAPAGGVATGWQTVFRSKDIFGPYEDKIVLEQGSTPINGPHQGGWVQTPSGQSWFIHFQDAGPYGRITHLQPVQWIDDWPVIGLDPDGDGTGEPVSTYQKPDVQGRFPIVSPAESDDFRADTLGLQWQWQATPQLTWYALIRGTDPLRLFATPVPQDSVSLWDVPNLLLQKFPAPDFTAETKATLTPRYDGKRAGLIIFGDDYAALSIIAKDGRFFLQHSVCRNAVRGGREKIVAEKPLDTDTLYLKVRVASPQAVCRFSYSTNGQFYTDIGGDFPAKSGRWVGAKVGLFCIAEKDARYGGYADFQWFKIDK